MRAFAVDSFGSAGSVRELPVPDPGEGEVLVRVHAAGVNVMDPIYTGGWIKDYMEHRFPLVPGIDVSGVVEAIGPGVTAFKVGDKVVAVTSEASAEHARALGAAETVDYAKDAVAELKKRYPDGVDALIDLHSDAEAFAGYAELVRKGGVAVSPRGPAGAAAPSIEERGARFAAANRAASERLGEVADAVSTGRIRVPPIKTFSLEEAPAAISEVANGHVRGKLVIAVR